MRTLLLAALLFLSMVPAWATFTLQAGSPVQKTSCSSSATTCTLTVTSTGSGHLLELVPHMQQGVNQVQVISKITGGGYWQKCILCNSPQPTVGGEAGGLAIWYVLSSTSGTTSVVITVANTTGTAWGVDYREYAYTASFVGVDAATNGHNASGSTTVAGLALTLTGTNDLIIQAIDTGVGASVSAVSTYGNTYFNATNDAVGVANLLNTTSGTAPNWTIGSASENVTVAIAFMEMSSAPSGIQIVHQTYCATGNTCTLTGTTAAGNAVIINALAGGSTYTFVSAAALNVSGSLTLVPSTGQNAASAISMWWIANITGGDTTLTLTNTGHTADGLWIVEVSGINTLENATGYSNTNASSTTTSTPSITTTHSSSFVFAGFSGSQGVMGQYIGTPCGDVAGSVQDENGSAAFITAGASTYTCEEYNYQNTAYTNSANIASFYQASTGPPPGQFPRVN